MPLESPTSAAAPIAAPADEAPTLTIVRFVFSIYLVVITVGLAFYIAIGLTNHQ